MSNKNGKFLECLAFFAVVITAGLLLITNVLPLLGVTIEGVFFGILRLIANIIVIGIIGYFGFQFVKDKSKGWIIVFWIAVIIYFVCAVCGLFA